MKNNIFHNLQLLLLGVVAMFLCISCSNLPPVIDDEPMWAEIAIIKLDESQLHKTMVSPFLYTIERDKDYYTVLSYSTDSLFIVNSQVQDGLWEKDLVRFAQDKLHILGTNPYIVLNNGYAVVNWRWRQFHPIAADWIHINGSDSTQHIYQYSPYPGYNNGMTTNEQFYLLDERWEGLTDLHHIWSSKDGQLIEKPEIRYVQIRKLDAYRKDTIDPNLLTGDIQKWEFLPIAKCYNTTGALLDEYTQLYDSIENVYVSVLNDIIKDEKFDLLCPKYNFNIIR